MKIRKSDVTLQWHHFVMVLLAMASMVDVNCPSKTIWKLALNKVMKNNL